MLRNTPVTPKYIPRFHCNTPALSGASRTWRSSKTTLDHAEFPTKPTELIKISTSHPAFLSVCEVQEHTNHFRCLTSAEKRLTKWGQDCSGQATRSQTRARPQVYANEELSVIHSQLHVRCSSLTAAARAESALLLLALTHCWVGVVCLFVCFSRG